MPNFRPWVWYAHCVLHDLVLIYPVYAIMMQDTGVSPAGFASLLAIWSASMMIFEVPSGVIGDLFPRKAVLVGAGLIRAAGFAAWLLWPTYWGFALGFVIWSLGSSFHSGTSEAFLYESLTEKTGFEKVYGRTEASYGVGVVAALSLGGYLAESGYELPLTLSIAAPLAASLVILAFLQTPPRRPAEDEQTFVKIFRSGLRTVVATRILGLLVSMSAVLAAVPGILEEYLGVLLDEEGFSLTAIGVAYGVVWLGRTFGSLVAHRLRSRSLARLALLPLVAAFFYLAASSGSQLVFVAGFVVYFGLFGVFDVLLGARLQNEVKDHHRATVTSVASMALEGSAILYALVIGGIAEYSGWAVAFTFSNVFACVFALLFVSYAYKIDRS